LISNGPRKAGKVGKTAEFRHFRPAFHAGNTPVKGWLAGWHQVPPLPIALIEVLKGLPAASLRRLVEEI
jgi:hypothetical protein